MSTLGKIQELAVEFARAVSAVAPEGWSEAYIYSEFLPDDEGLDHVSIIRCSCPKDGLNNPPNPRDFAA